MAWAQEPTRTPSPQELWEAYPLDPGEAPAVPTPSAEFEAAPTVTAAPTAEPSSGDGRGWLIVALAPLALVLFGAGVLLGRRRHRERAVDAPVAPVAAAPPERKRFDWRAYPPPARPAPPPPGDEPRTASRFVPRSPASGVSPSVAASSPAAGEATSASAHPPADATDSLPEPAHVAATSPPTDSPLEPAHAAATSPAAATDSRPEPARVAADASPAGTDSSPEPAHAAATSPAPATDSPPAAATSPPTATSPRPATGRSPWTRRAWRAEVVWDEGFKVRVLEPGRVSPRSNGDGPEREPAHVASLEDLQTALEAEGWTPAGRAASWYGRRFVWQHPDPPPGQGGPR